MYMHLFYSFLALLFCGCGLLSAQNAPAPAPAPAGSTAAATVANNKAQPLQQFLSCDWMMPGEVSGLLLVLEDGSEFDEVLLPQSSDYLLKLQSLNAKMRWASAPNGLANAAILELTALKEGNFVIDPIKVVSSNGQQFFSAKQQLKVLPLSGVKWHAIANSELSYGFLWQSSNNKPFCYETMQIGYKLILPNQISEVEAPNCSIANGALSRFNQRFMDVLNEPNKASSNLILDGKRYEVRSYSATLTAHQPGKIELSNAVQLVYESRSVVSPRFGQQQQKIEHKLQFPQLDIEVEALPEGAPADFSRLVGQYSLSAKSDVNKIGHNQAISVSINVEAKQTGPIGAEPVFSGSAQQWKQYPMQRLSDIALQQAAFQQTLRPLTKVQAIPAYSLCYFDPQSRRYLYAKSAPIALEWVGAEEQITAAQPSTPQAAELKLDLQLEALSAEALPPAIPPRGYVYAILSLLLLALLRGVWCLFKPLKRALAVGKARRQLKRGLLEGDDIRVWLRRMALLLQKYPQLQKRAEFAALLEDHNLYAFAPQGRQQLEGKYDQKTRRRMSLRLLAALGSPCVLELAAAKSFSLPGVLLVLLVGLLPQTLRGEQTAPAASNPPTEQLPQANFSSLTLAGQAHWSEQLCGELALGSSRQAHYYWQQGNAAYKQGQVAEARRFWELSLIEQPDFAAARHNLALAQKLWGADDYPGLFWQWPHLGTINYAWLRYLLLGGLLLAVLGLCCLVWLPRRHAKISLIVLLAGLCGVGLGGVLESLYPRNFRKSQLGDYALMQRADLLYSAASRSSAQTANLPAGSLLQVLARRGPWIYVAYKKQVYGWLPSEQLLELQ